jgi:hypothetical protein
MIFIFYFYSKKKKNAGLGRTFIHEKEHIQRRPKQKDDI